jgi:sulfatase modifying factor 1
MASGGLLGRLGVTFLMVLGATGTAAAQDPVVVCAEAYGRSTAATTDANLAGVCVKKCEGVEGSGAPNRLRKCRERLEAIGRQEDEARRIAEAEADAEAMAEQERKRRAVAGLGLVYVTIRGDRFRMGSDTGDPDEKPVHDAQVATFDLMKTEVSVAQYGQCVEAGRCTARTTVNYSGYSSDGAALWLKCNYGRVDRANHPMNCVDASDADAFCKWAGGARLPTESEWEFAARGKDGRLYPWGLVRWGSQNGQSWAKLHDGDDKWSTTAPVTSFPEGATPEGVLNLSGNVWEWTLSKYCPYTSNKCASATRVFRGGGWNAIQPAGLRGAMRSSGAPSMRFVLLGFRCAR